MSDHLVDTIAVVVVIVVDQRRNNANAKQAWTGMAKL